MDRVGAAPYHRFCSPPLLGIISGCHPSLEPRPHTVRAAHAPLSLKGGVASTQSNCQRLATLEPTWLCGRCPCVCGSIHCPTSSLRRSGRAWYHHLKAGPKIPKIRFTPNIITVVIRRLHSLSLSGLLTQAVPEAPYSHRQSPARKYAVQQKTGLSRFGGRPCDHKAEKTANKCRRRA